MFSLIRRYAGFLVFLLLLGVLTDAMAQGQRPGNRPGGGGGRGNFGGGFGGGFGGPGGGFSLGMLSRENIVAELKLTEEQQTKIKELSDKTRADPKVRELFVKLPTVTDEEREALRADIRKAMENQRKQADEELKKILSDEQYARYRQLALQTRGMAAFADTEIVGDLKLTDSQQEKLKTLSDELDKKRGEFFAKAGASGLGGDDLRTKLEEMRKENEAQRLSVLTEEQRKRWTELQGPELKTEENSNDTGSRFARRSRTEVNADAVGSQAADDASTPKTPVLSFGKAVALADGAKASNADGESTTPDKPADGTKKKGKAEKLSFNFRHAPWADVLKAFAELSELTLDLNVVPPGTFNYFDEREYSPTEALDVINGYLLQKGFLLVQRDQFLVVLNFEDGIPPNLVPNISIDELAQRGKNELLNIMLPLEGITAEDAAAEVKDLVGPQGSVVAHKKLNAISVTDIGSNLRRIQKLLIGMSAAPADITFRAFELKHIEAAAADSTVRQMFGLAGRGPESVSDGIRPRYDMGGGRDFRDERDRRSPTPPPPTASTSKTRVQVAIDERTNRLLVTAGAAEMKIIEDTLKAIDVAEEAGAARKARSREPYLEVYSLKSADAQEVAKTLNVLYPGTVVNEDGRARRLHIHATPAVHVEIERMIRRLDGEGSGQLSAAVIPLGRIDALTATQTLHALFAGEKDTAPHFQPHPTGAGLIVRGTADQVNQIKLLLSQMDPSSLTGEGPKGPLRTIPLNGRDPDEFGRLLQQFWSSRNSNPIIVVPSASKPIQDLRVPAAISPVDAMDAPVRRSSATETPARSSSSRPRGAMNADRSADRDAQTDPATTDSELQPAQSSSQRPSNTDSPRRRKTRTQQPRQPNTDNTPRAESVAPGGRPQFVGWDSVPTGSGRSPKLPVAGEARATVRLAVEQDETPAASPADLTSSDKRAQRRAARRQETPNARPRKAKKPKAAATDKPATQSSPPKTDSQKASTGEAPSDRADRDEVKASPRGDGSTANVDKSPILIVPSGGNLIIKSDDEAALDELEKMIGLIQQATPAKPRWTVFYLRSADATEMAAMLERLFPTSSVASGVSSSGGMLGELTGGIGSMGRTLMNASGLSTLGSSPLTLRIVPEVRSNALYVAGPADQVREVEQMLRILDASELPDQLRDRAPRSIEVYYADVDEVAAIVRDVYKDDLAPEGQAQGQQMNPFQMFMGGAGNNNNRGRSGNQQARTIKLTLGVDTRSNTLIVSASEPLFRQIESLVRSLDDAAREAKRTVRVVDLGGANATQVQQALTAMNSKIKVTSSGSRSSRSGSSSSGGSSGSSTSSPSFGGAPPMAFPPMMGGSSGGQSPDDVRRFWEQRMRDRMGGSGGGPSSSPPGR